MTWTDTLRAFVPTELRVLPQLQTDLPRIAKDRRLLSAIEHAIQQIPNVYKSLTFGEPGEAPDRISFPDFNFLRGVA